MSDLVDWDFMRTRFRKRIQLLDEGNTEVSGAVFIDVLEALHALLDRDNNEYTLAFYAIVDACRDPEYRFTKRAAAHIVECGFEMGFNHKWQAVISDEVRSIVLAATRDGQGQTKELLAIGEIAKLDE